MPCPCSGWDTFLGEFTVFLKESGVPYADEQAVFFLAVVRELENAIQNGVVTNIIESGHRPTVTLSSEESTRKVGHA